MAGSMLPPDIRESMDKNASLRRGGGIGAAVAENAASAQARGRAAEPGKRDDPPAAEAPVVDDLKACPRCKVDLEAEWNYCAKCGSDLIRGGAAKVLGITFSEQDIEDYLFRGYVVRDVKILGKYLVTMKSSQPQDAKDVDQYMMSGDWRKGEDGKDRDVSGRYLEQVNTLCITAATVQKINGESIGETIAERMKWMFARGSAFVDMLGVRATLFNRALTEHLKDADTILGS